MIKEVYEVRVYNADYHSKEYGSLLETKRFDYLKDVREHYNHPYLTKDKNDILGYYWKFESYEYLFPGYPINERLYIVTKEIA